MSSKIDTQWSYFEISQDELLLDNTLPTGQTFRWNKLDKGHYIGVLEKRVIQLVQSSDELHFRVLGQSESAEGEIEDILWDYFNLDIEVSELAKEWAVKDQRFSSLQQYIPGARMLRQDPLECLLSFLCSQNNNISRIKGMIDKLCLTYGQEIQIDYDSILEDPEASLQMQTFKLNQGQLLQGQPSQNGSVIPNGNGVVGGHAQSTEDCRYLDFMGVKSRYQTQNDQQVRRSQRKKRDLGAYREMGEVDNDLTEQQSELMLRRRKPQEEDTRGEQIQYVAVLETKQPAKRRGRKANANGEVKRTKRYGRNISNYFMQNGDYMRFFTFPTLEELQQASEQELRDLKFGYRAKYIQQTCEILSKKENGGDEWLYNLRAIDYRDAQLLLMQFPGIGQKVASCICLFSLDKHQAVPIDTHVWEIAQKYYLPQLQGKSLTTKLMTQVEDKLIDLFGKYSGWAHNTLFVAELDSHVHLLPPELVTKTQKASKHLKNSKSISKGKEADQIIEQRLQEATVDTQPMIDESVRKKRRKKAQ